MFLRWLPRALRRPLRAHWRTLLYGLVAFLVVAVMLLTTLPQLRQAGAPSGVSTMPLGRLDAGQGGAPDAPLITIDPGNGVILTEDPGMLQDRQGQQGRAGPEEGQGAVSSRMSNWYVDGAWRQVEIRDNQVTITAGYIYNDQMRRTWWYHGARWMHATPYWYKTSTNALVSKAPTWVPNGKMVVPTPFVPASVWQAAQKIWNGQASAPAPAPRPSGTSSSATSIPSYALSAITYKPGWSFQTVGGTRWLVYSANGIWRATTHYSISGGRVTSQSASVPSPSGSTSAAPAPAPSTRAEPHGVLRWGNASDGYAAGQCTEGEYQLAHRAMTWMGNGGDWDNTARARGYPTGTRARLGATVVFERGAQGASSAYGHVAHVIAVDSGGYWFKIRAMNDVAGPYRYGDRWAHTGYGVSFIYG